MHLHDFSLPNGTRSNYGEAGLPYRYLNRSAGELALPRKIRRSSRPHGKEGEVDEDNPLVEELADPARPDIDTLWDAEWHRKLLAAAIQRARRQVEPRQFQIFDCYLMAPSPRFCKKQ